MHSIRRWFYRPKKEDPSQLAQFYWADEELNLVAAELDSFDGRKDPERCSALVNQLRICQDKVLTICGSIMDEAIPLMRANRDFQAKFPDDILQENLAGQLWFGAECLAAGSNILNRELESASMRPLAKALTRALDNVRFLLREQCLRNPMEYSDKVKEALWIFDRLFADFELCYVSAMVPVKSVEEYHLQQEVVVLFSETLQRALQLGLVSQELVDDCDPSLMFTIPRLAIVCGLLIYPDGPLNVDTNSASMSELFRPFFSLLVKIRELLWTLTPEELQLLEKTLCSLEDPEVALSSNHSPTSSSLLLQPEKDLWSVHNPTLTAQATHNCKQFIRDFYAYNFGTHHTTDSNPQQPQPIQTNNNNQKTPLNELKNGGSSRDGNLPQQNDHHLLTAVFHRLGNCEYCNEDSDKEKPDSVVHACEGWPTGEELSQSLPAVQSGEFLPALQPWEGSHPSAGRSSRRRHSLIHSPLHLLGSQQSSSQSICIPRVHHLRQSEPSTAAVGSISSCSSCRSHSSLASSDWDLRSYQSTDTSSYHSECQDDEEIALALQAAEISSCNRARAKFRDSTDLIHRLFVCISGVADQLQTNFASDLRNILKCVFEINSTQASMSILSGDSGERMTQEGLLGGCLPDFVQDHQRLRLLEGTIGNGMGVSPSLVTPMDDFEDEDDDEEEDVPVVEEAKEVVDTSIDNANEDTHRDPPTWLPDDLSPDCMACRAVFTLIRRRHHCRNCGKIFCARCSSNSIPLPRFGHVKPVRVCNTCFVYQVTQLLVSDS